MAHRKRTPDEPAASFNSWPGPPPSPPRPNKLFLAIASLLLVIWLAFLLTLALAQ